MSKTLSSILSLLLLLCIFMGAVSLFSGKDEKDSDFEKISLSFSVGGLTNKGKYSETKYTLYTKESFKCSKLKVTPDFEANLKYQVFFYDESEKICTASEVYSGINEIELPEGYTRARLVLIPVWENNIQDKDKELGIIDTLTYSFKVTVEVAYAEAEPTVDADERT